MVFRLLLLEREPARRGYAAEIIQRNLLRVYSCSGLELRRYQRLFIPGFFH